MDRNREMVDSFVFRKMKDEDIDQILEVEDASFQPLGA